MLLVGLYSHRERKQSEVKWQWGWRWRKINCWESSGAVAVAVVAATLLEC